MTHQNDYTLTNKLGEKLVAIGLEELPAKSGAMRTIIPGDAAQ